MPPPERAPEPAPALDSETPAPGAPVAAPHALQRVGRRPLLIVAAGVVLAVALASPKVPRDQRLRVLLGPRARATRAVRLTWYTRTSESAGEALREATFNYDREGAPEALIQALRLPDGDYDVDVEIVTSEGRSTVRKRVSLNGTSTTLDLSERP